MSTRAGDGGPDVDFVVVGAGIGGLYAIHRLTSLGFSVQCLEAAPDVGGVWYHNKYPGARVDVESTNYCYPDPELIRSWTWTERYPSQPELHAYLRHAADTWGVTELIRFNTRVVAATWAPGDDVYEVETDAGDRIRTRFLVLATGQLSEPRTPAFEGLETFEGIRLTTSHWPDDAPSLDGLRVGVIGTGSSGVQTVTELAGRVGDLYVFQRTPNYSVPANNRPLRADELAEHRASTDQLKATLLDRSNGTLMPGPEVAGKQLSPERRRSLLEERWAHGGHTMNLVFTDQNTDVEINDVVADFVREKVRSIVTDPGLAEAVLPSDYPIGCRRLIVDTGYYECFNRDNVHLVNLRSEAIRRISASGVETTERHIELDALILALGFDAFTGAVDRIDIRNEHGQSPTSRWGEGPRTYLGLMTRGFPNMFFMTGPGSPSVLANMVMGNVHHGDLIGDLAVQMRQDGHTRVEPTPAAEEEWTEHVSAVARPLLRFDVENYMVHVAADGARHFIPYAGGFDRYVRECRAVMEDGWRGFQFAGPVSG